jgi:hypothetical protein
MEKTVSVVDWEEPPLKYRRKLVRQRDERFVSVDFSFGTGVCKEVWSLRKRRHRKVLEINEKNPCWSDSSDPVLYSLFDLVDPRIPAWCFDEPAWWDERHPVWVDRRIWIGGTDMQSWEA